MVGMGRITTPINTEAATGGWGVKGGSRETSGCHTGGLAKCWRKPVGASRWAATFGKCPSRPKTSEVSAEKLGIWEKVNNVG